MKKRTYTKSPAFYQAKKKLSFETADIDKRIEILTLRNQGWTFEKLSEKYGISKQAVHQVYSKASKYTLVEWEEYRKTGILPT